MSTYAFYRLCPLRDNVDHQYWI
ncbi:hypothetical protein F383_32110 [Gossypium arboreum]|uniref:Uncharacterized protein n=1 Tax=Gossypium arboreum TaxID=29729 RepID=A0A0B0PRQ5_GOSAR|nr:hypothetical protein F383_32110 [Gossypium arboreum]